MNPVEVDLILAAFAVGMALTTAVAVKWAAYARGPLRESVVVFILTMMSGMFAGVLVYYALQQGTPGLVAGFWAAAAFMSVSVLIVFIGFLREMRLTDSRRASTAPPVGRRGFLVAVVFLVILNEFLMGWSFSLLAGSLAPHLGTDSSAVVRTLAAAIVSPWFVFPMALEMVVTLQWLLPDFPALMRRFLLVQPAIMVCSPPTVAGDLWAVPTAVGASALMGVAVAWLLLALFRDLPLSGRVAVYLSALVASFGVMAAGLYIWAIYGSAAPFALALLVQMVVFLRAVTDPEHFGLADRSAGDEPTAGPALTDARTGSE